MMSRTYTLARLEVSEQAFNEISRKLRAAGYDHLFRRDGGIELTGLCLEVEQETEPHTVATFYYTVTGKDDEPLQFSDPRPSAEAIIRAFKYQNPENYFVTETCNPDGGTEAVKQKFYSANMVVAFRLDASYRVCLRVAQSILRTTIEVKE